ncbi:MAG: hypothetical protein AAB938_00940 [Patescibacteria group bacterium]
MKGIQKLLERWEKIVPAERAVRATLPAIIKKETGADVPPQNISVVRNVVFVKTASLIKTEIFIKKKKILAEIALLLGKEAPQDIR